MEDTKAETQQNFTQEDPSDSNLKLRQTLIKLASKIATPTIKLMDKITPPAWLTTELQNRVIILINHILQQENEAMQRLKAHAGKTIVLNCAPINCQICITSAGLLNLIDKKKWQEKVDLTLTVLELGSEKSIEAVSQGNAPDVKIEGDVQLAADINWLIAHVRWDIEEDLSHLIGDRATQLISQGVQAVDSGVRNLVNKIRKK